MKSPVVLVTPIYNENTGDGLLQKGYWENLTAQGALGLTVPPVATDEELAQLCKMADGFLFTGGPDIDPAIYGQEKEPGCGGISPCRDTLETRL